MQEQAKSHKFFVAAQIGLLLLFPSLTFGMLYLRNFSKEELISDTIMAGIAGTVVVYLQFHMMLDHRYGYDNELHWKRFYMILLGGLVAALMFPFLPVAGWPYLIVFILLSMYGNLVSGFVSGTMLLMLSVLLTPGIGFHVFFLYFLSGLLGVILFNGIDSDFKVEVPIFITMLFFGVLLMADIVLFENRSLSGELFIVPVINILVCFFLLLLVLKTFNTQVVNPYRGRYLEINDQQHPLLIELKQKSRDTYMEAIHTVHFAERIADKIGCDVDKVKTASYYYQIGMLRGENNWENVKAVISENHFPQEAVELLKECLTHREAVLHKEAAIVLLSDSVIRVILTAQRKMPDKKPDYQKLISVLFDRKVEAGFLNQCDISIREFLELKQIFLEENLYYDFLL